MRFRARSWLFRVVVTAAVVCAGGQARADTPDFKVAPGFFFANYDEDYGVWYGVHARVWLLDVTGKRKHSGFLEVVHLRWELGPSRSTPETSSIVSTHLLARYLHNWNDTIYTFVTLGATAQTALFPRLMGEFEINFHVPQLPVLVFTVGGGDRYFPGLNRPYLLGGVSYSFPKTAFIYRYWLGRGIAKQRSATHLLTWVYGARQEQWVRLDLLFGDEGQVNNIGGLVFDTDVDSRGLALTWEKWFGDSWGFNFKVDVTEGAVRSLQDSTFHRWQIEIRPFWTF